MPVPISEQLGNLPSQAPSLDEKCLHASTTYWICLLLCALVLALPILTVHYLPMVDLPNHIARDYILFNYDHVPEFQARYRIELYPLPNLAMDLVVVPLQHVMSVTAATRAFVLMTALLFLVGCHALEGAIKHRHTFWALFCSSFVYTSAFLFGFVNYVFGLGLFLVVFAIYLRWREIGSSLFHAAILAFLAAALYVAHLTAFGFLAVSVGLVALWDFYNSRNWRRLLYSAGAFVPTFAMLIAYKLRYNTLKGESGPSYFGLTEKINVLASLVRTFNLQLDYVLAGLFFAILTFVLWRGQKVRINLPVLIVAIAFGVLTMATPFVYATSYYFDLRFLIPSFVLFILAVDVQLSRRDTTILIAALAIFASTRIASIWHEWLRLDRETAAVVASLDRLPEGCRIATRQFMHNDPESRASRMVYSHAIHYATLTRHCTAETLFAIPGQQPLLPRSDYDPLRNSLGGRKKPLPISDDEFVMTFSPPERLERYLDQNAEPIFRNGEYALWEMRPGLRPPVARSQVASQED